MGHTEHQFMTDKELDTALRFAEAHVERQLTPEHVEHYAEQVRQILQEKRLRAIIADRRTW